jgi:mono/diheme cytochrome c family protein
MRTINWVVVSVLLACMTISPSRGAETSNFEAQVLPILRARCVGCHGGSGGQAGLDLSTREGIFKGGRSGPVIQPGASDKSPLVEKIVSRAMPPTLPKLTDAEIALIRLWVDKGDNGKDLSGPVHLLTEADVLPIFQMRCVVCHGKRKQEGGLDLRFQASRLKGGKSGPAIVPGKPEESLLLKRITSGQMPPPKLLVEYLVRPPSESEVDLLRRWIAGGAMAAPKLSVAQEDRLVSRRDREFWAFQPIKRPPVPAVHHADLARNPIDAFLLQKLEEKNLGYSSAADRTTLLRRAWLDLTGLPPAPSDVDAYLHDNRPDAYERVIDRLLASPQYGERWAKFWLDAAGYADSEGIIDEDLVRHDAWRYRDYVIRALNEDKPYDQFLTEQIAGDELVDYKHVKQVTPGMLEKLTATGFLRLTPDGTYSPANGSVAERMNVIADEIEVLSSSVMGLTVGCARCHNHKYDPIPQRDYYRLSAILQSAYDPYDWIKPTERYLDYASESEIREVATHNAPIEAEIKRAEAELDAKIKPLRDQILQERLAQLPEAVRADLLLGLTAPKEQRTAGQAYLLEKFEDVLKVTDEAITDKFPKFKAETAELHKAIAENKGKLSPKPRIRALYEMGGEASPTYLLRRGEAQMIGEPVEPGVPSVLKIGLADYKVVEPRPDSTGRRLAFARWLVQPNHPLTARVMVNRIWMHHFGRGIVASAANFGHLGTPPSHPELLDWLATEFVASGWSLKSIHRLIMTSAAYRQSSELDASHSADPDNILLGRMAMRRMDAEQLHDSILSVTGELDATAFGPPVSVETTKSGEVTAQGSHKKGWRRSIYALQRRTTPPTLLEVFDLPPMSPNCIQRAYSTVATQALQMTNSPVMLQHARYLAGRLLDISPDSQRNQIEELYFRALSHRPTPEETDAAIRDLNKITRNWEDHLRAEKSDAPIAFTAKWYSLADLCQAVLSSAAFAYID